MSIGNETHPINITSKMNWVQIDFGILWNIWNANTFLGRCTCVFGIRIDVRYREQKKCTYASQPAYQMRIFEWVNGHDWKASDTDFSSAKNGFAAKI